MSRVKKLTLAVVGVFFILAFLFSMNVNADDHNVTWHGHTIEESEIAETQAQLKIDRALSIQIKGIKKVNVNILSTNSLEMSIDDKIYTIIVDCKLTEIDNFQWQTRGDGRLNIGDFAIVRRNPFKYFDNPNLELTKEQVESKLEDWDFDQRTCTILALQLASKIEPKAEKKSTNIKIRQSAIRGFETEGLRDDLIFINTREKGVDRKYKLDLAGCWDMNWSQKLLFDSFSNFYVQVGDSIYYQGFMDAFPKKSFCRITGITDVTEEEYGKEN